MEGETKLTQPIFRDLTGEDPDPEITDIESLCMNCFEQVSAIIHVPAAKKSVFI